MLRILLKLLGTRLFHRSKISHGLFLGSLCRACNPLRETVTKLRPARDHKLKSNLLKKLFLETITAKWILT